MELPVPATEPSLLQLLQQLQALLQEQTSLAESLQQENASLKHQLDWFKQQLFGEKSEKRLIDNPNQLALGEFLKDIEPVQPQETKTITYQRRKKNRSDDCVTDQGYASQKVSRLRRFISRHQKCRVKTPISMKLLITSTLTAWRNGRVVTSS